MTEIAFAAKRNMAHGGSGGAFAAYVGSPDGQYLGDVGRVVLAETRLTLKPHAGGRGVGWWALPAGQSARLAIIFPSRNAAAAALLEA